MTRRLLLVLLLGLGLAAGCDSPERLSFPEGTTMARLQAAGTVTVGVKFDQPGVGFRNLATGKLEGFDIEIAKIVARRLGIETDRIRWKDTKSRYRESYLQDRQVDFLVASFSINAERTKKVGQAGPYYVAGQQLLVRKGDSRINGEEDLTDRRPGVPPADFTRPVDRICSVTGSTSLDYVAARYEVVPVERDTYTGCVQLLLGSQVDAVTTDDAILLGYVGEQPDKLKVVGAPFTKEEYGIGFYPSEDVAFCQFLTETLRLAREDGSWAAAFERTLGKAGVPMPAPPEPRPCQGPAG